MTDQLKCNKNLQLCESHILDVYSNNLKVFQSENEIDMSGIRNQNKILKTKIGSLENQLALLERTVTENLVSQERFFTEYKR